MLANNMFYSALAISYSWSPFNAFLLVVCTVNMGGWAHLCSFFVAAIFFWPFPFPLNVKTLPSTTVFFFTQHSAVISPCVFLPWKLKKFHNLYCSSCHNNHRPACSSLLFLRTVTFKAAICVISISFHFLKSVFFSSSLFGFFFSNVMNPVTVAGGVFGWCTVHVLHVFVGILSTYLFSLHTHSSACNLATFKFAQ